MARINDLRSNAVLQKKINYSDGGIMTRKEWIEMQFKKGAKVEQSTKDKIKWNRVKYNRMGLLDQIQYEKKCDEKIICYDLYPVGVEHFNEITKTEFDYFNNLK